MLRYSRRRFSEVLDFAAHGYAALFWVCVMVGVNWIRLINSSVKAMMALAASLLGLCWVTGFDAGLLR